MVHCIAVMLSGRKLIQRNAGTVCVERIGLGADDRQSSVVVAFLRLCGAVEQWFDGTWHPVETEPQR
jgi:hypothetical protein